MGVNTNIINSIRALSGFYKQVSFAFSVKVPEESAADPSQQWFSLAADANNKIFLFKPQVINIEERGAELTNCFIGP
jgi:hypothetical protein